MENNNWTVKEQLTKLQELADQYYQGDIWKSFCDILYFSPTMTPNEKIDKLVSLKRKIKNGTSEDIIKAFLKENPLRDTNEITQNLSS